MHRILREPQHPKAGMLEGLVGTLHISEDSCHEMKTRDSVGDSLGPTDSYQPHDTRPRLGSSFSSLWLAILCGSCPRVSEQGSQTHTAFS